MIYFNKRIFSNNSFIVAAMKQTLTRLYPARISYQDSRDFNSLNRVTSLAKTRNLFLLDTAAHFSRRRIIIRKIPFINSTADSSFLFRVGFIENQTRAMRLLDVANLAQTIRNVGSISL